MSKTPLNIHIIWHNDYEPGLQYAEYLYNRLTRNLYDSLSRGVGIPIYFHTHKKTSINFEDSTRNVLIIFINTSSILDETWNVFVNDLNKQCDENKLSLMLPVSISNKAFNLKGEIAKKNFIRLFEKGTNVEKRRLLIQNVSNEICRFLYGIDRISETKEISSNLPVKFFISHAKIDGKDIAKQINSFILTETPLKTFFDANDIRYGEYFQDELVQQIKNEDCVLLVIQTDKYASREWCRLEIMEAKLHNKPLVVLSKLTEGEYRSFPYMSNVRTVKRGESTKLTNEEIEDVIVETLLETLKFKYQKILINHVVDSFDVKCDKKIILSYPPELLSCVSIEKDSLVFYPEPPLSGEEMKLLGKMDRNLRFYTPSQIPTINSNFSSKKLKVGISISSNEEIEEYGVNFVHLKDYLIEMSRYLISSNLNIVFGGDLNRSGEDNYLTTLIELIHTYRNHPGEGEEIITNFTASFLSDSVTKEQEAEVSPYIKYNRVTLSKYEKSLKKESRRRKVISLSNMRKKMNLNIDYRISIGGKFANYLGIYPGVFEEIYIALIAKKPVFLIGGFGGVTKEVIDIIRTGKAKYLTEEHQYKDKNYELFVEEYNDYAKDRDLDTIEYKQVVERISKMTISDLNNGLSDKENEELFKTKDLVNIITLVLKGISNNEGGK